MGFLVDDIAVFKVEIVVYGELEICLKPSKYASSEVQNEIFRTSSSLDRCLVGMLKNPVSADIQIIVGSCEDHKDAHHIPAHRCILMARSPVFRAMLSSRMAEHLLGEIIIDDFDYEVVEEMLHFVYTDCCTSRANAEKLGEQLLGIASKYQLYGLIDVCETVYKLNMHEHSVIDILCMADRYSAQHLKSCALQYIVAHSSSICGSKRYLELEGDLKAEIDCVCTARKKRSGCGATMDKERRFSLSCVIM